MMFMVVALIAGILGSPEVAATAAWMAKALFVAFIVLTAVAFLLDRRRPA